MNNILISYSHSSIFGRFHIFSASLYFEYNPKKITGACKHKMAIFSKTAQNDFNNLWRPSPYMEMYRM
jgi:hypothetical protein